ncbi:MAG: DNA translocase FtsK 4TM domain-containing protein, partial [Planctomycetes bacterium]|nr:DNA translocase FtsK 4TM domain-containing protein [Planctomycetota bacterium]
MFENRSLKFDLLALTLLGATALLAVSMTTYDATDPPSTLVYPPHTDYQNACGPIGAYVAHFLLESVGLGAYYLVASLGTLSIVLLWRRGIDQPVLRAVGWAASLVALATLATMALPKITPGPEIGAGGYLGAMGHALLESYFASTGAYILALTVLLAGMLLCTDYLLLKFAAATTIISGRSLLSIGHLGHSAKTRRQDRPETDLEDEFEEDEEEYEYEAADAIEHAAAAEGETTGRYMQLAALSRELAGIKRRAASLADVDRWDKMAAALSKELGRPVKLMLDRDLELKNAGSRPSGFVDVKVGADSTGLITIWDSHHWSAGGFGGGVVSQSVVPYVIV